MLTHHVDTRWSSSAYHHWKNCSPPVVNLPKNKSTKAWICMMSCSIAWCQVKEHKVVFPIVVVQCFPGGSHSDPVMYHNVSDNVLASITTLAVAGLAASADSKNHRIALLTNWVTQGVCQRGVRKLFGHVMKWQIPSTWMIELFCCCTVARCFSLRFRLPSKTRNTRDQGLKNASLAPVNQALSQNHGWTHARISNGLRPSQEMFCLHAMNDDSSVLLPAPVRDLTSLWRSYGKRMAEMSQITRFHKFGWSWSEFARHGCMFSQFDIFKAALWEFHLSLVNWCPALPPRTKRSRRLWALSKTFKNYMFHQISKFMHDISCFFGAMMIMTFWYHDVCVCVCCTNGLQSIGLRIASYGACSQCHNGSIRCLSFTSCASSQAKLMCAPRHSGWTKCHLQDLGS